MKKLTNNIFVVLLSVIATVALAIGITACKKDEKAPQPTPLAAPEIQLSGNVISWDEVDNATGYSVYEGDAKEADITDTYYTISKEEPGTYTYTVVATSTDSAYTQSAKSNAVTYTVVAKAPIESPVISLDKATKTISWQPVSVAVGYRVYLDDEKVTATDLAATVTSYTIPDTITDPGEYTYTVVAVADPAGTLGNSLPSNAVKYYVQGPLPAPTGVSVDGNVLSWTAVDGATSYVIYKGISAEATDDKVTEVTGGNTTTYTINEANAGTFYYAVSANAQGSERYREGEKSAAVEYIKPADLAKPVVTVEGTTLSWGKVDNAEAYEVYCSDVEDELGEKVADVQLVAEQQTYTYTIEETTIGIYYYTVKAITTDVHYASSASEQARYIVFPQAIDLNADEEPVLVNAATAPADINLGANVEKGKDYVLAVSVLDPLDANTVTVTLDEGKTVTISGAGVDFVKFVAFVDGKTPTISARDSAVAMYVSLISMENTDVTFGLAELVSVKAGGWYKLTLTGDEAANHGLMFNSDEFSSVKVYKDNDNGAQTVNKSTTTATIIDGFATTLYVYVPAVEDGAAEGQLNVTVTEAKTIATRTFRTVLTGINQELDEANFLSTVQVGLYAYDGEADDLRGDKLGSFGNAGNGQFAITAAVGNYVNGLAVTYTKFIAKIENLPREGEVGGYMQLFQCNVGGSYAGEKDYIDYFDTERGHLDEGTITISDYEPPKPAYSLTITFTGDFAELQSLGDETVTVDVYRFSASAAGGKGALYRKYNVTSYPTFEITEIEELPYRIDMTLPAGYKCTFPDPDGNAIFLGDRDITINIVSESIPQEDYTITVPYGGSAVNPPMMILWSSVSIKVYAWSESAQDNLGDEIGVYYCTGMQIDHGTAKFQARAGKYVVTLASENLTSMDSHTYAVHAEPIVLEQGTTTGTLTLLDGVKTDYTLNLSEALNAACPDMGKKYFGLGNGIEKNNTYDITIQLLSYNWCDTNFTIRYGSGDEDYKLITLQNENETQKITVQIKDTISVDVTVDGSAWGDIEFIITVDPEGQGGKTVIDADYTANIQEALSMENVASYANKTIALGSGLKVGGTYKVTIAVTNTQDLTGSDVMFTLGYGEMDGLEYIFNSSTTTLDYTITIGANPLTITALWDGDDMTGKTFSITITFEEAEAPEVQKLELGVPFEVAVNGMGVDITLGDSIQVGETYTLKIESAGEPFTTQSFMVDYGGFNLATNPSKDNDYTIEFKPTAKTFNISGMELRGESENIKITVTKAAKVVDFGGNVAATLTTEETEFKVGSDVTTGSGSYVIAIQGYSESKDTAQVSYKLGAEGVSTTMDTVDGGGVACYSYLY